jgi:hypothetical protein
VRNQSHIFCRLAGTLRARTRFAHFTRARRADDLSESNLHARRPPRLIEIFNRLPAVRIHPLALRVLSIMYLPLDLNHFEEFPVERESARLAVLHRARFKSDFALDDIYLIPLNRENFSDPHTGVIHRDEYAARIFRKRAAQLSVLIVVEKTLANVVFLRVTNSRQDESNLAVFLPQIEHPSQGGKSVIDRRDRGARRWTALRSAGLSFIESTFGRTHSYYEEFDKKVTDSTDYYGKYAIGILSVIRDQIYDGWIETTKGLVTAEVFADFLEMAEHLLDQKYKDAAAVVAGSVLEEHLRQLCGAASLPVEDSSRGRALPRKADSLNADLAKAGKYSKLDKKKRHCLAGLVQQSSSRQIL